MDRSFERSSATHTGTVGIKVMPHTIVSKPAPGKIDPEANWAARVNVLYFVTSKPNHRVGVA